MIEIIERDGSEAIPEEKRACIDLITIGGAVEEGHVEAGINRAGVILFLAKDESKIVGVAALKIPNHSYRTRLESIKGSQYSIPAEQFPFELGYVATAPEYTGQGIAKKLTTVAVNRFLQCSNQGIFATTSDEAMLKTILPDVGFKIRGEPWPNENSDGELRLMTRSDCSEQDNLHVEKSARVILSRVT